MALGTGHITIQEAKKVVKEAAKAGVKKIIVTHPLATFVNYSNEDMKEALDNGALFLEHVFNDVTRQVAYPITQKKIAEAIRAIGAKYIVMSTDSGQWLNPIPGTIDGNLYQGYAGPRHFGGRRQDDGINESGPHAGPLAGAEKRHLLRCPHPSSLRLRYK